jgi:hypothetical protein
MLPNLVFDNLTLDSIEHIDACLVLNSVSHIFKQMHDRVKSALPFESFPHSGL